MSEIIKIHKEVEDLNLDIVDEKITKKNVLEESLSVVEEVRGELANAYVQHKKQVARIEELNSQLASLAKSNDANIKTIESLNKELDDYKSREAEAANKTYTKRLENLSSAFKELGQKKTVEELSALSEEVITEFESITSLALKQRTEETLSIETVPTQAMVSKSVESKPVAVRPRSAEMLSTKELAESICRTLATEQKKEGPDSRRIVRM